MQPSSMPSSSAVLLVLAASNSITSEVQNGSELMQWSFSTLALLRATSMVMERKFSADTPLFHSFMRS